jgi:hypothetical protein
LNYDFKNRHVVPLPLMLVFCYDRLLQNRCSS